MDAAGFDHANILGISEGGPMAVLFAATYPDRVDRLALVASFPWGGGEGHDRDGADRGDMGLRHVRPHRDRQRCRRIRK